MLNPLFKLDKKTKNRLVGALRTEFKYSPLHKLALQQARIEVPLGLYKNGNEKFGVFYVCARCAGQYKPDCVDVDHIQPIGPIEGSLDDWVYRAWCMDYGRGGLDNLQVLCKSCHKIKSSQDRAAQRG